ncbi:MAG: class I SAM-dependent methyltransferase [Bacteroidales bacterium]|nr:MAG: class I SAM-dependent methyltransferase [Bacteroidales bacterium]
MIISTQCLVCHSTESKIIYSGRLIKCLGCGFVTANLDRNRIDPEWIYSEEYFRGEEYLDYVGDKKIIQKNFGRRIRYIIDNIDVESFTSVLEIGCAYGFFGEMIRHHFPGTTYLGLDIAEKPIKYAGEILNLDTLKIDYLDFRSKENYTDVFMWDVIEHLLRPDLVVEKIHSELKSNGRLYITTGDIGAVIPRIRKAKWRHIHPPTHLNHFSSETLTKLLESRGFRITKISYPFIYRGLKQIFYSLFLLGKNPWKVVRTIFNHIPGEIYLPLNTFDTMFVIAVRQ